MTTKLKLLVSLFHADPTLAYQPSTATMRALFPADIYYLGDFGYQPFKATASRWKRLPQDWQGADLHELSEPGRWATQQTPRKAGDGRVHVFSSNGDAAKALHLGTLEPMAEPPLLVRAHRAIQQEAAATIATLEPCTLILSTVRDAHDFHLLWCGNSIYLAAVASQGQLPLEVQVAKFNQGRSPEFTVGCANLNIGAERCVAINFQKLYNRMVETWTAKRDLALVLTKALTMILKTTSHDYFEQYRGWYA